MLRMLRRWCGAVLCALLCGSAALGQSAEQAFSDSLMSRPFVLRNFSGQAKVEAKWTGTAMEFDKPLWRELSVINPKSVTFADQMIVITGTRHGLIYDKTSKLRLIDDPEPVEIDVETPKGMTQQALPSITNNLFFATTDEALAAIPKKYEDKVPARMSAAPSQKLRGWPDCSEAGAACSECRQDMKAGRIIHMEDPSVTDEMRWKGSAGAVTVVFTVNEAGHTEDFWLSRPAQHDADEQTVLAIAKWFFQPATCHDKPIPMTATVNMRFR